MRLAGKHGLPADRIAEPDATRRQGQPRLPAVQRVVIAVADEGADTFRSQPVQPFLFPSTFWALLYLVQDGNRPTAVLPYILLNSTFILAFPEL